MNGDKPASPPGPPPPDEGPIEDETTGLPGIRRWSTVYVIVFAIFVMIVAMLAVFPRLFA